MSATIKVIIAAALLAAVLGLSAPAARATTVGYVNNPSGNSLGWTAAALARGLTIDNHIDFEGLPLTNNFTGSTYYLASEGVTLTVTFSRHAGDSNENASLIIGPGPAEGNTLVIPHYSGEGVHPSSEYLRLKPPLAPDTHLDANDKLIIDFNQPVFGVGGQVFDLFNPNGFAWVSIEAFNGPGGTGTSLGSYTSVNGNFQNNYLYFMGLLSTSSQPDIRSVVFTQDNRGIASSIGIYTDIIGIDNIVFATDGGPHRQPGAVPEPLTVAGLALGLVAAGRYARRRVVRR